MGRFEMRCEVKTRMCLLLLLEVLVLDTSLIFFDSLNGFHTFVRSQEPCIRRGVGEEEAGKEIVGEEHCSLAR